MQTVNMPIPGELWYPGVRRVMSATGHRPGGENRGARRRDRSPMPQNREVRHQCFDRVLHHLQAYLEDESPRAGAILAGALEEAGYREWLLERFLPRAVHWATSNDHEKGVEGVYTFLLTKNPARSKYQSPWHLFSILSLIARQDAHDCSLRNRHTSALPEGSVDGSGTHQPDKDEGPLTRFLRRSRELPARYALLLIQLRHISYDKAKEMARAKAKEVAAPAVPRSQGTEKAIGYGIFRGATAEQEWADVVMLCKLLKISQEEPAIAILARCKEYVHLWKVLPYLEDIFYDPGDSSDAGIRKQLTVWLLCAMGLKTKETMELMNITESNHNNCLSTYRKKYREYRGAHPELGLPADPSEGDLP